MILLPHQKSSLLAQLEVIIPRLANNDPIHPVLTERLKREKSGYIGEKSLDYYLNFFTKKIQLLHDAHMEGQDNYFQIDSLLLFPNFFLIIETKNYTGTIEYDDDSGMLIRRRDNGRVERFDDPLIQVNIQRYQLQRLLVKSNYSSIPIHTLVVFSNPNAILQFKKHHSDLITSQQLVKRIPELHQQYPKKIFSTKETYRIGEALIKFHKPYHKYVLKEYAIEDFRI